MVEEAGVAYPGEKEAQREDLIFLYKFLSGGFSQVRTGLFCHIPGERVRGNGPKIHQGKV